MLHLTFSMWQITLNSKSWCPYAEHVICLPFEWLFTSSIYVNCSVIIPVPEIIIHTVHLCQHNTYPCHKLPTYTISVLFLRNCSYMYSMSHLST